ncbi:MAG TPA: hypothetical protein PKA76_13190, partial [Pirellulaceae bacterium]|nr:hypothetical protein [Pirellulaceae bacterium]
HDQRFTKPLLYQLSYAGDLPPDVRQIHHVIVTPRRTVYRIAFFDTSPLSDPQQTASRQNNWSSCAQLTHPPGHRIYWQNPLNAQCDRN